MCIHRTSFFCSFCPHFKPLLPPIIRISLSAVGDSNLVILMIDVLAQVLEHALISIDCAVIYRWGFRCCWTGAIYRVMTEIVPEGAVVDVVDDVGGVGEFEFVALAVLAELGVDEGV